MTNGAKVYVCGLESDPIEDVERELGELGKASGGSAVGYDTSLSLALSNDTQGHYIMSCSEAKPLQLSMRPYK